MATIKHCLMTNETPEARLFDIRQRITPTEFVSGPTSRYDSMYTIVRKAMTAYGIECRTKLPAGAPVWKNLVAYVWPAEAETIFEARAKARRPTIHHGAETRSKPAPAPE